MFSRIFLRDFCKNGVFRVGAVSRAMEVGCQLTATTGLPREKVRESVQRQLTE